MITFTDYLASHLAIENQNNIAEALDALILNIYDSAFSENSLIFTIGNGGSASTAEHFAADLSQMQKRIGHTLRALCLNSQVALNSAFANDLDYSVSLAAQLSLYKDLNFILIAFSASGNSKNILEATNLALEARKRVHCFVGFDGGIIRKLTNANIIFFPDPERDYGKIENLHLSAAHYVIDSLLEKFGGN